MQLAQDLDYAWRQLRRSPGFALAAVLTLALGIAATTTMFSVVDQVLLRPLPYQDPSRLVSISENSLDQGAGQISYGVSLPDVQDYETRSHTLQSIGYWTFQFPVVSGVAHPQSISQQLTSSNFFTMLGVRPVLGRSFAASENSGAATHVMVLGDEAWAKLFGRDRSAIGRGVTLNGTPYAVIGVMPASFRFQGGSDLIITPLDISLKDLQARDSSAIQVLGRLRADASPDEAARELQGIKQQNLKSYPGKERDDRVVVENYARSLTESIRPGLLLLNGLVLAVWLLATVNVAGLLLTRTQGRRREIAVRAALGASSSRLVQQFLLESLLLSVAGGALGLAITAASLKLMHHYLEQTFQNGDIIHVDAAVCLYVLAASCASALLFGLLPALQAARLPIQSGLREGSAGSGTSRRQGLLRDGIVTVEVALSLLLLIAAGVMARALYQLERTPLGFNPEKVVTAELIPPQKSYWFANAGAKSTTNIVPTLVEPMLARIRQLPGVSAAGVTTVRPLRANYHFDMTVEFAGRPKPDSRHEQSTNVRAASPDFFRAMGINLLAGRLFEPQDSVNTPIAALVNQAFTRQIAGARSPVGLQVEVSQEGPHKYATIVGVVADARQDLEQSAQPELLLNLEQMTPADDLYSILAGFHLDLAVRSGIAPQTLIPAITRIVHELNPDIGVNHAEAMQTTVADSLGSQTLAARLLALFALIALVIAAAGLYSLLAYQVSQQRREFGVRLALGAQRGDLLWLVLRRALILLAIGVAAGTAASLAFSRFAQSVLYGVDTKHLPLVIEAVAAVLALACITAGYLPARRAAHIDPIEALRHE